MHRAEPFVSVVGVSDVAGPGLALDVDDDATDWSLKVHRHERAQVALGVLVRVVVSGEATSRVVLDRANVLDIGRVLALARHPHGVHGVLFLLLDSLDVVLEFGGHVAGQLGRFVEEFRDPSVDLVELQEYAGGALVVVVLVLQRARVSCNLLRTCPVHRSTACSSSPRCPCTRSGYFRRYPPMGVDGILSLDWCR